MDVVKWLKTARTLMGESHPTLAVEKLGTRSIRSGAAMALFMKNTDTERIKILGRWSSDAFLVYIRPQILEWTNLMAAQMAESAENTDTSTSNTGPQNLGTMPSFI